MDRGDGTLASLNEADERVEKLKAQRLQARVDSVQAISQTTDWKANYDKAVEEKANLEKHIAELEKQKDQELIQKLDNLTTKVENIKIPEKIEAQGSNDTDLQSKIRKLEQDKKDLNNMLKDKTELDYRYKQSSFIHYSTITAFLLTVMLFSDQRMESDFLTVWTRIKDIFYNGAYNFFKQPQNKILSFCTHWIIPSVLTVGIIVVISFLLYLLYLTFSGEYRAEKEAKEVHILSIYNLAVIIIELTHCQIAGKELNVFLVFLAVILIDISYLTYRVKIKKED